MLNSFVIKTSVHHRHYHATCQVISVCQKAQLMITICRILLPGFLCRTHAVCVCAKLHTKCFNIKLTLCDTHIYVHRHTQCTHIHSAHTHTPACTHARPHAHTHPHTHHMHVPISLHSSISQPVSLLFQPGLIRSVTCIDVPWQNAAYCAAHSLLLFLPTNYSTAPLATDSI